MLGEEDIQKVRLVLASDGWNHVMKPALHRRGTQALKALALTRPERAVQMKGSDFDTDDDVLRAMIRESEWMLSAWDNEVLVFEHNRKRDELARQ